MTAHEKEVVQLLQQTRPHTQDSTIHRATLAARLRQLSIQYQASAGVPEWGPLAYLQTCAAVGICAAVAVATLIAFPVIPIAVATPEDTALKEWMRHRGENNSRTPIARETVQLPEPPLRAVQLTIIRGKMLTIDHAIAQELE